MANPVSDDQHEVKRIGHSDEQWLRARLEELERIERPSASAGELEAAEWIKARFEELGADARIETEPAHGTYWWPIGIGTSAGMLGGLAAATGRRLAGAILGAFGVAVIARDFPPHSRPLRRLLAKRSTHNVVCELGEPEADRTVVFVSHHDAAHAGLIFHPGIPKLVAKTGLFTKVDTSPMLMAPVIGGPALAVVAAVTGSKRLAKLAAVLSAGSTVARSRRCRRRRPAPASPPPPPEPAQRCAAPAPPRWDCARRRPGAR